MTQDQILLGALILAIGFLVVLPLVYWLSTRRPQARDQRRVRAGPGPERMEPVIGDTGSEDGMEPGPASQPRPDPAMFADLAVDQQPSPEQGELLDAAAAEAAAETAEPVDVSRDEPVLDPAHANVGARRSAKFDRIVSLFVRARGGHLLRGDDLVVVAEKVGLVYGNMGIYHRLVDGRESDGPVFSMANIAKPGGFDLRRISELETPGLSFFMTLPGPLPALDAWNTLLPVAQRVAQLLEADLLDESRNPLVEQTIGFIRNEMRQYDREQEKQQIRPKW